MTRIVVVDYHKGNLKSVERALVDAGAEVAISDDPSSLNATDGIVIPGVGSFFDAMEFMETSGQAECLRTLLSQGVPCLGICLGMQLFFSRGNEGINGRVFDAACMQTSKTSDAEPNWVAGLGLISGSCVRLESDTLKVPHVGWDHIDLSPVAQDCPLLAGVADHSTLYFTHSYACADDIDASCIVATTDYTRVFASIIWKDNLYGCQFHPEKSSSSGARIVENFVRIVRAGVSR